jgi:RND family efflux transporter MFP subunit
MSMQEFDQKNNLSKYKSWLILLFILIITAIIIVALSASKKEVTASEITEKSWSVTSMQISRQSLSPQISLYGHLESPVTTTITAKISADVSATPVLDGSYVNQGQSLVILDAQEIDRIKAQREADLIEAKANFTAEQLKYQFNQENLAHEKQLLKLRQSSVDRTSKLQRQNMSAQTDLETAQMALTQQALKVNQTKLLVANHENQIAILNARVIRAESNYQQALDDFSSATIKAPFQARITHLHVAEGDRVSPGSPLITLFDTSKLAVRVNIPNITADRIRQQYQGTGYEAQDISAEIMINGETKRLTLNRLAGEVQRNAGGVDAIFTFEDPQFNLPLGQTLKVTLILPKLERLIAVPSSAVYQQNTVYLIKDERLKSVPIKRIGTWSHPQASHLTYWIIDGDLKEGDTLLTSVLPNAIDGLKVSQTNHSSKAD